MTLEQGHGVALDGRPLRTPQRRPLAVPTPALAAAIAAEWQAQGEVVDPITMPLNRLATSVVDLMPERRRAAIDQICGFAATDLLCYRAPEPGELLEGYRRHWDPPLAWLRDVRGVRLVVVDGLMPAAQPTSAVDALGAMVRALDDWRLVGTHAVATATGSLVLALMVEAGAVDGAAAAAAALVEERFQRRRWGDEAEALAREAAIVADVVAADQLLRTLLR